MIENYTPTYKGYTIQFMSGAFSPADATSYYIGLDTATTLTAEGRRIIYVPKDGTIAVAYVRWYATGTAGTNEDTSIYVRLNGTTDTLISTLGNTDAGKVFSNTGLSISVSQGDFLELKLVCPTWATNPTTVSISGILYIE